MNETSGARGDCVEQADLGAQGRDQRPYAAPVGPTSRWEPAELELGPTRPPASDGPPMSRPAALVVALAYMTLSLGAAEDAHMIRLALLVFSALAFIWFCEELGVVLGSSARTVAALGWVLLVFPALAYAVAVIASVLR